MKVLLFAHRWLGVALCLLFLLWFTSGIGMMYWQFPEVRPEDHLARAPALDAATVMLSPAEAYARTGLPFAAGLPERLGGVPPGLPERLGGVPPGLPERLGGVPPGQVTLTSFDGRPVYRIGAGGGETIVYADTGEEQGPVPDGMMRRLVAAWTGQPVEQAVVERIEDVDQWTVQSGVAQLQPLWKFSWPDGEQVYFSQAAGEVVQHTTRRTRIGAYLGPIPHWLYFTPLRRHGLEWSRTVIWSSGIGTLAAAIGIVVGVWMYSPSKRYQLAGAPTAIPYRGQKRWHMVLGLVFGVATATWAFSGMLSMDPFPTAGGGSSSIDAVTDALGGELDVGAFAPKHPREALTQLAGLRVKALELVNVAGSHAYLATLDGGDTRLVPLDGAPVAAFDWRRLIEVATAAVSPAGLLDVGLIDRYDAYYVDRRGQRPLPVIRALVNDADRSRVYIDPATARVVATYSSRDWVNRWVYHGLHSLDFPWLYNYRPAWDVVVLAFMLGGTTLSVTSLVLAWRVVGRTLRARGDLT